VLLPSSTDEQLVVKLEGGYNVGVDREAADVSVLAEDVYEIDGTDSTGPDSEAGSSEIEFDDDLPTISLLSTGGTIASTIDYRTGAVTAQFDAEDVLRAVPDLAGRANYRGRVVANILSENMEPPIWRDLAEAVHEEIEAGADGVVVMHGTDTMQYSASALSFMLETPVPIVFTGSQRSADRPSSDNVMKRRLGRRGRQERLRGGHGLYARLRIGRRLCAPSGHPRAEEPHLAPDAFETVGAKPLGEVNYEASGDETVSFRRDYRERGAVDLSIEPDLEDDVELLKFTPGMDPQFLDVVEGSEGLVIEGTGLGHVHTDLVPRIAELIEDGTTVVMTSQCLEGGSATGSTIPVGTCSRPAWSRPATRCRGPRRSN